MKHRVEVLISFLGLEQISVAYLGVILYKYTSIQVLLLNYYNIDLR